MDAITKVIPTSGSSANTSGGTTSPSTSVTSPAVVALTNTSSVSIVTTAPASIVTSAKPSSSPITVRFNAGDDTLDDILQSFHKTSTTGNNSNSPCSTIGIGDIGFGQVVNSEQQQIPLSLSPTNKSPQLSISNVSGGGSGSSLSSSPSQQQQQQLLFSNDEVNLRNNFLQGSFFNRKRSGSIEGVSPTTGGPILPLALSTGDSASGGGTWKLIKGKVTQTIEEIKSSKSHNIPNSVVKTTEHSSIMTQHENDSDIEYVVMTTPIGNEASMEQVENSASKPCSSVVSNVGGGSDSNSDTEMDNKLLLDSGAPNIESSRLRRGIAHIKSKVKPKTGTLQFTSGAPGSCSANSSSVSTLNPRRGNFLRKRQRSSQVLDRGELVTPSTSRVTVPEIYVLNAKSKNRGIINAKRDVEVESGVEVLEDMVPVASVLNETELTTSSSTVSYNAKRSTMDLNLEGFGNTASLSVPRSEAKATIKENLSESGFISSTDFTFTRLFNTGLQQLEVAVQYVPFMFIILFLVLTLLPLHDFMRGIFATLLVVLLVETSGSYIYKFFKSLLIKHPPETTPLRIPDYDKMPICEIPAVEEHKTIKMYSGWLNELNSYDPNSFSFSLTRSVYVRLDGSVLKLSGTNARIPKRVMWNDPPIDRSRIVFTDHRTYNLTGSRIELLPLGLAKKRYFNRKYPIQLIIKLNSKDGPSISPSKEEDLPKLEAKDGKTMLCPNLISEQADEKDNAILPEKQMDFSSTILNSDLQKLQGFVNSDSDVNDVTIPCGDEVRLLLFTRSDREKEDWYRRFVAASKGAVFDQDFHLPNVKFVDDNDLQAAATKAALMLTNSHVKTRNSKDYEERVSMPSEDCLNLDVKTEKPVTVADETNTTEIKPENVITDEEFQDIEQNDDTFQGLLMSACAARNPSGYISFMAMYQSACNQTKVPVYKEKSTHTHNLHRRKQRRAKRQEDELWKGIDQSLFLGPSGSVVWANVLFGRCMYSCLHDRVLHSKIQDFLQKKLNSIKLPGFMENVNITQIQLGETPILIHRISQPMLDERGTWLDADITYEGLAHITVTTKLNLLRMKRPKPSTTAQENNAATPVIPETFDGGIANTVSEDNTTDPLTNPIYDSDAESSGSSSTESESPQPGLGPEPTGPNDFFQNSQGNARRIFKIVDRIATSNFFQYATELPYVQRAMENMNANITLRVDLKGLVARATLNMPPPPSDRIWMCFRGPPRLWIRAKPTLGDKSVDWSIVTNVIESKLCEAVNKYLVYPNMVDFSIPFLGKPTCEEFTTMRTNSTTTNNNNTTNDTNIAN